MSETVNQEATTQTQGQETRTFTQEELNAVVNDRLKRERQKYADLDIKGLQEKAAKYDEALEAGKSELQKATDKAAKLQAELDSMKKAAVIQEMREKVAKETNVPIGLLTADTEEACMEQAKGILEFARPSGYPNVRDGGEVHNNTTGKVRDQFADWFNQNY